MLEGLRLASPPVPLRVSDESHKRVSIFLRLCAHVCHRPVCQEQDTSVAWVAQYRVWFAWWSSGDPRPLAYLVSPRESSDSGARQPHPRASVTYQYTNRMAPESHHPPLLYLRCEAVGCSVLMGTLSGSAGSDRLSTKALPILDFC